MNGTLSTTSGLSEAIGFAGGPVPVLSAHMMPHGRDLPEVPSDRLSNPEGYRYLEPTGPESSLSLRRPAMYRVCCLWYSELSSYAMLRFAAIGYDLCYVFQDCGKDGIQTPTEEKLGIGIISVDSTRLGYLAPI